MNDNKWKWNGDGLRWEYEGVPELCVEFCPHDDCFTAVWEGVDIGRHSNFGLNPNSARMALLDRLSDRGCDPEVLSALRVEIPEPSVTLSEFEEGVSHLQGLLEAGDVAIEIHRLGVAYSPGDGESIPEFLFRVSATIKEAGS